MVHTTYRHWIQNPLGERVVISEHEEVEKGRCLYCTTSKDEAHHE